MHSFYDKNKKRWDIELNVGTARRVLKDCGINLIDGITIADGKAQVSVLEQLANNPFLLVDVLFSLCRTQCEKDGIDDYEFASLIDGDVIEQATDALLDEIINFSQPAKRKVLMHVCQKTRSFAEKMKAEMEAALKDPALDAEIESQLKKSFSVTQESSESTPPPTPSGS